jgi:hypothetical protein
LAILQLHVNVTLEAMLANGAPVVDTQEFVRVSSWDRCITKNTLAENMGKIIHYEHRLVPNGNLNLAFPM